MVSVLGWVEGGRGRLEVERSRMLRSHGVNHFEGRVKVHKKLADSDFMERMNGWGNWVRWMK